MHTEGNPVSPQPPLERDTNADLSKARAHPLVIDIEGWQGMRQAGITKHWHEFRALMTQHMQAGLGIGGRHCGEWEDNENGGQRGEQYNFEAVGDIKASAASQSESIRDRARAFVTKRERLELTSPEQE